MKLQASNCHQNRASNPHPWGQPFLAHFMRYISFNYSSLDRFRQAILGSYMVNAGSDTFPSPTMHSRGLPNSCGMSTAPTSALIHTPEDVGAIPQRRSSGEPRRLDWNGWVFTTCVASEPASGDATEYLWIRSAGCSDTSTPEPPNSTSKGSNPTWRKFVRASPWKENSPKRAKTGRQSRNSIQR